MILAIDPDDRNLIAATCPLFEHTFPPIGIEGFDRWDLRQMHMGCWGEGVKRIGCRWGVRELHGEERGIVEKLGGNVCYWLLDTGVKFGLMTQMVLEGSRGTWRRWGMNLVQWRYRGYAGDDRATVGVFWRESQLESVRAGDEIGGMTHMVPVVL
nr:hypothetical protein [Tanacetum cinerariifolium]